MWYQFSHNPEKLEAYEVKEMENVDIFAGSDIYMSAYRWGTETDERFVSRINRTISATRTGTKSDNISANIKPY